MEQLDECREVTVVILKLEHIYKDYIQGKMTVPVLKDVSLYVEEGEYVAIMGPSGSGISLAAWICRHPEAMSWRAVMCFL